MRRERERLAAGAGGEIDNLLPGLRARQQRGKLRAFVLHLDRALEKGRLGMDGRVLRVRRELDAQALRRPSGWLGMQMLELRQHLFRLGLERVDAQIEGRAACERGAFGGAVLAEHP